MSRLPIRVRLTLVFALVMAVMLATLGAFLYVRLQDSLDERIADQLENRSASLTAAVLAGEAAGLDPALFRSDEGIAQVIGPDGGALFPSGDSIISAEELERARRGPLRIERTGFRLRVNPIDGNVVVVGESLEDRDEALGALLAQLLIALPLALLAASGIGYLVAGAALRPVETMRRRAAEISSDTRDRRLPLPEADDEIRRLGETLNEMLGRLDEGLARERRFVADASHELRTPLAALRTELELASRRPRSQGELEAAVRSAGEEVERLVRLADDLLVLARTDEGELALRLELSEARVLLDRVANRRRAEAALGGRAIVMAAPDDLVLTCDVPRLEQALGNLVDNALVHGAGTVRVGARAENGRAVLTVSDEGAGFAPSFVPHAFERFSRADPARTGRGAGLGLAIVDAIARAHGGEAYVDVTEAATVRLELPSRLNASDVAGADSRRVR